MIEAGIACRWSFHSEQQVKYGLSVMGTVHPKHIYSNNTGPSDVLILTKKLGWKHNDKPCREAR